jgi:hypothetical protein
MNTKRKQGVGQKPNKGDEDGNKNMRAFLPQIASVLLAKVVWLVL